MAKVVLCTCPDKNSAKELALQLVKKKLAACVNIMPSIESVFYWENQIEISSECLLMIKIADRHYANVEAFIVSHHPYTVPEIIALPITEGSKKYLEWVEQ